jgi:hypothetical protein
MDYCFAMFGYFCSREEGVNGQTDVERNREDAQRIPPSLRMDKPQQRLNKEDESEAKRSKPGAAAEAASSCLFSPVKHGKSTGTKVLSNSQRVVHPCASD